MCDVVCLGALHTMLLFRLWKIRARKQAHLVAVLHREILTQDGAITPGSFSRRMSLKIH